MSSIILAIIIIIQIKKKINKNDSIILVPAMPQWCRYNSADYDL